jgi:hypothetical protein
MKVRIKDVRLYSCDTFHTKVGDIVEAKEYSNIGYKCLCSYSGKQGWLFFNYDKVELIEPTDQHYNNTNGSLYKFAQDHDLNAYEFDIVKRIVRCRKKGQFKEDLEKTKRVIDLYLKEFEA